MELVDPAFQNTVVIGVKPTIPLAILAFLGSFFFGALLTALRRGINEEGWFKFKKGKDEN